MESVKQFCMAQWRQEYYGSETCFINVTFLAIRLMIPCFAITLVGLKERKRDILEYVSKTTAIVGHLTENW